jgi:hypothetical protein
MIGVIRRQFAELKESIAGRLKQAHPARTTIETAVRTGDNPALWGECVPEPVANSQAGDPNVPVTGVL